jgi:dipeptidyl aminopeptidase/acylaminoacyl peptidase
MDVARVICSYLAGHRANKEAFMSRITDRIRLRLARARQPDRLSIERAELWLRSSAGYRIAATVHMPPGAGPFPAVVLCPGSDHDRRTFQTNAAPVHGDEVAALGVVVVTYDPSGRGQSWGPEDFGGTEHQDNVVCAVEWLRKHPKVQEQSVGLVGISLGVSSAVGAAKTLARRGNPVAWVVDWEGPCDQRTITANQTMNAPAMGHKATDQTYWIPREAVRSVGEIEAKYWRLQADPDHAQPTELDHARRMMSAASKLVWFRLNHHPVGEAPSKPTWLKGGPFAANRAIIKTIQSLIARP